MTPAEYGEMLARCCEPISAEVAERAARILVAAERERVADCWVWTAAIDRNGYGRIMVGGRSGTLRYAHRLAYETFVGPIPDGFEIDHLCRNRACSRPEHLEAVTPQVNVRRACAPAPRPSAATTVSTDTPTSSTVWSGAAGASASSARTRTWRSTTACPTSRSRPANVPGFQSSTSRPTSPLSGTGQQPLEQPTGLSVPLLPGRHHTSGRQKRPAGG